MLSELHNLNLKLCSKQYNKNFVLHLIVAPQISSGWQHNYSTKQGRQTGPMSSLCILLSLWYQLCFFERICFIPRIAIFLLILRLLCALFLYLKLLCIIMQIWNGTGLLKLSVSVGCVNKPLIYNFLWVFIFIFIKL